MKTKSTGSAPEQPDRPLGNFHAKAPVGPTEVVQEHAVLTRMLGCVQRRMTVMVQEHDREVAQLQAEIIRMRAQVIIGATALAVARQNQEPVEQVPENLQLHIAAADRVICQTGCVSHGDYWRAQDQCRRTGKVCVLALAETVGPGPNGESADPDLSTPAARA